MALSPEQFWHGSPSGDMRGAHYGLHIGTRQAALEALNARIGKPAEGEWDGTRIYGKTLLDRNQGMQRFDPQTKTWTDSTIERPPTYPTEGGARYSDSTPVAHDAIPDIFPVKIVGPMTNTPQRPHEDWKANGYMSGQIKRGRARSGYFYENISEDEGSISAVVPGASHVERLDRDVPKQMRLF